MLGLYLFIIAFWLWFCLIIADEKPVTFALFSVMFIMLDVLYITLCEIGDLFIQAELSLYDN